MSKKAVSVTIACDDHGEWKNLNNLPSCYTGKSYTF